MTDLITDTARGDNDTAVVVNTALAAAAPALLDPAVVSAYVVPAGASVAIPDLERYLDQPRRKRGIARPATVDSLIGYVKRHHIPDWTTIWVHPTSGRVVAVIDDDAGEAPAWREHRAELQLAATPEWMYWLSNDGRMMGQEDFAEHVETGLNEIVEPDAATMLEIAQTFHASTSAQFRSSTRLASGEQRLQYDEEVKAAAGAAGDLLVPTQLKLAIAPFVGEEPKMVTARLRFRVRSGQLTLGYKLDRPDAVARDALEKIAERLEQQLGNTFIGDPPGAS